MNLNGINTAKVEDMNHMFYNCSSLTEFEFFDGAVKKLTSVGASAFENCSNMTGELRIFNTVTSTYDIYGKLF